MGMTEDEMAWWHHWLDGCEFEWTLGFGDGQGGLACCYSWGCKGSDTTEQLNWTELNWIILWDSYGRSSSLWSCSKRQSKYLCTRRNISCLETELDSNYLFSSARSISIKSFNISLKQYVCSSQFMDMLRYSNLSALLQIIKFSQVQI